MKCVEKDLSGMGKLTAWMKTAKDQAEWFKLAEEAKTYNRL